MSLVAVNVLSINLAALVVLWYVGYRPEHLFQRTDARTATLQRITALLAAIALLSLFLGGVTYDSYQSAQTEQEIREAVDAELNGSTYAGYELLDLEVRTETRYVLLHRPGNVTVRVGVPPDADRPGLADEVETRIQRRRGIDVTVAVVYLEFERSE